MFFGLVYILPVILQESHHKNHKIKNLNLTSKEFDIIIFLVVHLRKVLGGKSFELGAIPTLDDLRGSGTIKQLSWDVIGLSRNQQHGDPVCANTTLVSVLKCRFTGRTGPSDYLYYSQDTGRMTKTDMPQGYNDND